MTRVEETQERLEQSGLLSDGTIQKLMEIRELMASLDTPELRSAAQDLQEAMQKTDREEIDQAMARLLEQQDGWHAAFALEQELITRTPHKYLARYLHILARPND